MSDSQTSVRSVSGLLARLIISPLTVVWNVIWPKKSVKDPAPEQPPAVLANTKDAETPAPPPDYHGQYVQDRQALLQTAKVAAVVFGVLFVLTLEYTPMVVADDQLEDQFSGQVRSLVLVEGYVDRLDHVVANGLEAWKQRVVEQVERALRNVIALDAYSEALAASAQTVGTKPDPPTFLATCRKDDSDVDVWVDDAKAVQDHWRDLVARCIIEPIDADFDRDGQIQLIARLKDARSAVSSAITRAREEFPASSAPSAEISTEQQVQTALDNIEAQVGAVVHIVENGANAAVQPPPRIWLARFAGADGTLRSFRDNLMLAYTSPFGNKLVASSRSSSSSNRDVNVAERDRLLTSTLSFTVSLDTTEQQLAEQVTSVMERQNVLQAGQAKRTAEIQSAVPGVFQPILAVVRPKYLVLGYPLALASVSAYLLLTYTAMRWRAGMHGAGDSMALTALIFLGLALAPLAVLTYLFQPYDWPQFADSWWLWMHRGPLISLSVIVLACMLVLLRPGTTRSRTRPGSRRLSTPGT